MKHSNLISCPVAKRIGVAVAVYAVTSFPPFGGIKGGCQNISINTTGAAGETGVMLDIMGTNPKATTAMQTIFQVTSYDATASQLKLRLILGTNATPASRYGALSVEDFAGPTYRFLALQPSGGNVGIGTTSPNTLLDVNGSIAWREGTALAFANASTNNNVAISSNSFFRITGPTSTYTVTGLTGGADGRIVTLYNTTAATMTIVNNATSTAANRILTLTGADITTPAGPNVVCLQYNSTTARWILIGGQNYSSTSAPGYGFSNLQVFNANGTFTVPAGVTKIMVEVWGAGGGGGTGLSGLPGTGGGGGGGGGYGKEILTVTPSITYQITVDAGGAGAAPAGSGTNGAAGGASCFSTLASCGGTILISANGGGGGLYGSSGGGGGTSSATINITGDQARSNTGGTEGSRRGGSSPNGGTGGWLYAAAKAPGGGGMGGSDIASGETGANGRVIVWW